MKMKYSRRYAFIRASRVLTDKVTDLLGEWATQDQPLTLDGKGQSPRPSLPCRLGHPRGLFSKTEMSGGAHRDPCVWTPPLTRTASCGRVW